MATDIVAINGQFFAPAEAKISVFDRGFLFGDAVYEVTRSYGHVLFQLESHIDRLCRSAEAIDLNLGMTKSQIVDELYRIYRHVNKPDRYLRWQVTRGEGEIGMSISLAKHANWIVYVKDIDPLPVEQYKTGAAVVTSQRVRNPKAALDPNIKSGNYLNNVLAYRDASKVKAAEAVLVDTRGYCTEGTTSNIFRVKNGVVQTPPSSSDLLQGITRNLIFEIAKSNGIPLEEALFTPQDLETSDEAFFTGSVREIVPISQVNDRVVPLGPVVQRLSGLYKKVIQDYCAQRAY